MPALAYAIYENDGVLTESEVLKTLKVDVRTLYYDIGYSDKMSDRDLSFEIKTNDSGEYSFF